MTASHDRGRGILTPKQREFITSSDEERDAYSRQERYRLRRDIRENLRNAMLDLSLLFQGIDEEDLAESFATETKQVDAPEDDDRETYDRITKPSARAGLPGAIALFARAENLDAGGTSRYPVVPSVDTQPAFADFTRSIEKGLEKYIAQQDQLQSDVSVTIDVTGAEPIEELKERLESGEEPLDFGVLAALESAGVGGDEIQRLSAQAREASDEE